jgi:hypothetical protein
VGLAACAGIVYGLRHAMLRVHVRQEMRRRPEPVTVLPDVEIVHWQLGSGEDVEL